MITLLAAISGNWTALRDEYMRSADGFLVVFDVSNKKTFGELSEFRKQIQRAKDNPFPCMVIVGNKCDLPDSERDVAAEEAQALAKEWNVPYLEARYCDSLCIMHACSLCQSTGWLFI